MMTMQLPMRLGKGTGGDLTLDLAALSCCLVAGGTGTGKSVLLRSIVKSFAACRGPESLRLALVDPKGIEFDSLAALPQLLVPPVTGNVPLGRLLEDVAREIHHREEILRQASCEDIERYNRQAGAARLPRIVLVVDEFADYRDDAGLWALFLSVVQQALHQGNVGFHAILSTQCPDFDDREVFPAWFPGDIPCRIAFHVASAHDSQVILGCPGAERLSHSVRAKLVCLSKGSVVAGGELVIAIPSPTP